jgi:ribosome biogenesis GTPase / thiamine phosphate phosphatase
MDPSDSTEDNWRSAQVIAAHGTRLLVRNAAGAERLARPAGRNQLLVCGDWVECRADAQHDELHVQAHATRRSALYRSDARGRSELIAANVSLLIVVVAPLPRPDLFMLDRYLAAAASTPARAVILAHKSDLQFDADTLAGLAEYQTLGYQLLHCSSQNGDGLDQLRNLIRGESAILVGQSGVGKSSLLRALVPESGAAIGSLMRDEAGRHTTTTTRLYPLAGGALFDSPGVRDFAPSLALLDARSLGFAELDALAQSCRFADCRHLQEPDCAVRAAVKAHRMSERRYESYRRLRRLHDDQQKRTR